MTYTANHKNYDHEGNLFPQIEYSPSERPHMDARVVPWIPVEDCLYDKRDEDYFSVAAGKPIALTRDGYVVPAGWKAKLAALAAAGDALVYTTADVAQRVTDPITGTWVDAAGTVEKSALAARWHTLGYIDTSAGEDAEDMISCPIGVAPYPYFMNFGGGADNNPALYRQHNYNRQHNVAVLCDYVIQLPWIPEAPVTTAMTNAGTLAGTATELATNILYIEMTANVPIAQPSPTASWIFSGNGTRWFRSEKTLSRQLRAEGDFMVDADVDKIYLFSTSGTAVVNTSLGTVVYYHYNSTTDPTNVLNYAGVIGPVKPGDFLVPTAKSNFKRATALTCDFSLGANGTFSATALPAGGRITTDILATEESSIATALTLLQNSFAKLETSFSQIGAAIGEQANVVGQVIRIIEHPRGALEKVRTTGNSFSWSTNYQDKMPGSATKGIPDLLTYAKGANKTVVINIIHR